MDRKRAVAETHPLLNIVHEVFEVQVIVVVLDALFDGLVQ